MYISIERDIYREMIQREREREICRERERYIYIQRERDISATHKKLRITCTQIHNFPKKKANALKFGKH